MASVKYGATEKIRPIAQHWPFTKDQPTTQHYCKFSTRPLFYRLNKIQLWGWQIDHRAHYLYEPLAHMRPAGCNIQCDRQGHKARVLGAHSPLLLLYVTAYTYFLLLVHYGHAPRESPEIHGRKKKKVCLEMSRLFPNQILSYYLTPAQKIMGIWPKYELSS